MVSGQLDRGLGGPAVGRAESGHVRRTLYSTISRRVPDKLLVAFDFPDANVTAERRDVTTVPQQQLFMLNSEFMITAAKALATQATARTEKDCDRIDALYLLAFCRLPTVEERKAALEFIQTGASQVEMTVWDHLAQAMLAANEFSWLD
jgi:hypothetical protein